MMSRATQRDRPHARRRGLRVVVFCSGVIVVACSGADQAGGGNDASIDPITGEGGSRPPPPKADGGTPGKDKPERGKLDVEGEFNICPSATVLVTPAEVRTGSSATLIAEAVDPDSSMLTYTWWISDGNTTDIDLPRTTYLCTASGEKQLRLTVSDGTCSDTVETTVSCVDPQ